MAQIIVFARSPIPGRCKTRLKPALGGIGAARLQRRLMERTIAEALATGLSVHLLGAPGVRHPALHRWRSQLQLGHQPVGDLGLRMSRCLNQRCRGGISTVLVGTDSPDLSCVDLLTALHWLESGVDFALQASNDGGFVMIGARKPIRGALTGVRWSSGRELMQTAAQLSRQGSLVWLPPRQDVDLPADYRHARRAGLLPALPGSPIR